MYTCPQNHQSDTSDYCSVCGQQIAPAAVHVPASAPAVAGSFGQCPECAAAKVSDTQIFCEGCGYNFRTSQPGTTPPAAAPPVIPAVKPPAAAVGQSSIGVTRWDVVVHVDPNLYGAPNPDAPVRPDQTFTLFDDENLIGRAAPGVRVQVPIAGDGGVSRRHAVFKKTADGLSVRDLGSANGSQLNGVDLVAGVETPVKHGDSISIGAWTRLTLRAVQS